MLKPLRAVEPIVAETFAEADRVMTPLLGKPLSEFIFVDKADADAVAKAEDDLRQTAITQPAVLATDLALTRLLAAYGITPDFTMGHSLGEYGALLAADALPFADALEAVSARGREMTRFAPEDKGRMAAVFAPLEEIERILKTVTGYVVIANVNSNRQAVIGGASKPVEQAMEAFQKAGYDVSALSVSHAFHTTIVAAASDPLRRRAASVCILRHHDCPSSPTSTASSIPRDRTSCHRCWTSSHNRSPLPFSSLKACARSITLVRDCSWKSVRKKHCRVLLRMCSASAAM
jgi:malonyl CoA-acyl carrier protein transacylase